MKLVHINGREVLLVNDTEQQSLLQSNISHNINLPEQEERSIIDHIQKKRLSIEINWSEMRIYIYDGISSDRSNLMVFDISITSPLEAIGHFISDVYKIDTSIKIIENGNI